jgi:hypothetical protein
VTKKEARARLADAIVAIRNVALEPIDDIRTPLDETALHAYLDLAAYALTEARKRLL